VPALLSGHLSDDVLEILLKRLDPAVLVTDRVLPADLARRVLSLGPPIPGALTMDDVRGSRVPVPRRRHDDDPLVVNHTSGTTGVPKLVVHTTRTIVHRLARFEAVRWPVIGVRRDDVVANAGSYAHGRTFCWTASVFCLAPRKIVLLSTPESLPVLERHRPTTLEALPSACGGSRRRRGPTTRSATSGCSSAPTTPCTRRPCARCSARPGASVHCGCRAGGRPRRAR
jgi:acyl-coenzyme A synthetase/AMP-(fatty) acid ligase